jgi:hypothetical protein
MYKTDKDIAANISGFASQIFSKTTGQPLGYNTIHLSHGVLVIVGQPGRNEMSVKPTQNGAKVWGRVNDTTYSIPIDKVKEVNIILSRNDVTEGAGRSIWVDDRLWKKHNIPVYGANFSAYSTIGFQIHDTDKNKVVRTITSGSHSLFSYEASDIQNIGITLATEDDEKIGSVRFELLAISRNEEGEETSRELIHTRTETSDPYSLAGDNGRSIFTYDFEDGEYYLKAELFSEPSGGGEIKNTVGIGLTIIHDKPSIEKLVLVDASDDSIIMELSNDGSNNIDPNNLPPLFEIRAITNPRYIGAVKFDMSQEGKGTSITGCAYAPPYAIKFSKDDTQEVKDESQE